MKVVYQKYKVVSWDSHNVTFHDRYDDALSAYRKAKPPRNLIGLDRSDGVWKVLK